MPPESAPDSSSVSRRQVLKVPLVSAAGAVGGLLSAPRAEASEQPLTRVVATSPNGRVQVILQNSSNGLQWSVRYDDTPVILPSTAGLRLASGEVLGEMVPSSVTVERTNIRGSWMPSYGRQATLSTDAQETMVSYLDPATGIRFGMVLHASDSGAAIRYTLDDAPDGAATLAGERTRYRFPGGSQIWVSRDEGTYSAVAPGQIPISNVTVNDRGQLADVPVTAVLPSGVHANLSESAREHYPRLLIRSAADTTDTAEAYLATCSQRGSSPVETTFTVATPFETPWRTVTLGASATELVDHADLVTSLARPSILPDTSWIRPGKAYRCTQLTTAGGLASVDLAVARNLQYVHFDAGWYGPETNPASDPRIPIPALDLPQVIAYAHQHRIGISLYVNRVAMDQHWDEIVELYEQWGVAAIKMGFVFEGTQTQNDRLFEQIRKAGEHHILINAHDNLRPAGLERTLPNYITLEGVRGNEQFPTARDNVTHAFARNIPGPIDYTICYQESRLQTTRAHQLAMAAVYYSGLEWLYWYAPPTRFLNGPAELSWFDAIPTTWHESRALQGEIGQYVVLARRDGAVWYLGAMTNETARAIRVPLSFLASGTYIASVYADGAPAEPARSTPIVISQQTVDAEGRLDLALAPSGGQAIRFDPA
jgi:alpha-glucosidase